MSKKLIKTFLGVLIIFLNLSLLAQAVSYQDLEKQINEKKKALEQLEEESRRYNEELSKVQQTKRTLSNELNRIQSQLKSLNFQIKVTETQIEKLVLEIEKLNFNIKDTSEELNFKKQVLARNLQNLYEQSTQKPLIVLFLENKSVSSLANQLHWLINFSNELEKNLEELQLLKETLTNQKEASEAKKRELEIARVNLTNQKKITTALQEERILLLNKTKNQEKNYQSLLQEIEKKRAEIEAEIERLEETLKAQIDPSLLPAPQKGLLSWPLKGPITQGFGKTSSAQYFYSRGYYKTPNHNGIDIKASLGTPVFSSEEGEVVALGDQDRYCYKSAYGKFVVIRHNNNLTTLYAHLAWIAVSLGQKVKKGEVIGYVGNTGFSTGPHLHFTVYFSPTFRMTQSTYCGPLPIGAPLNPLDYLE